MRLKNLLQSKFFYIIVFIFLVLYVVVFTVLIKHESKIDSTLTTVLGKVTDYKLTEEKLTLNLLLDSKEEIIVYYYITENDDFSNLYGSIVSVSGEFYEPSNNTIPNVFNYKEYLYYNGIYYLFSASSVQIVEENFNIKNYFVNRASSLKTNAYVLMFTLGNKDYLDDEIYSIYQENGIAHLLAISGMHISLFILILEKLLNRTNKTFRKKIIFGFLVFYAYLTNFAVSVLRCVIFESISNFSQKYNLRLSKKKILFLSAGLLIIYNPFYVYSVGFLYSFIITYFLISVKNNGKENYFISAFKISLISFLASLPITVSMNYEVNLSSIFFNIIFVPYVSFIVFPLSLITFVFNFFDNLLLIFVNIFEMSAIFCNEYLSTIINIPKMSYIVIVMYYFFLYLFVVKNNKYLILLILSLIINKSFYIFDSSYYVYYLDIGQGDCELLISPYQKNIIMIDTGGNYYYSVSDNVIVFLKSLGITSIDLLMLSHGDSDHALETENIYNEIEIKNIMFNENEYNDLELSILNLGINQVYNVDLKYFSGFNLNENLDNENDASLVYFFTMYNYDFVFTGDIGTNALEDLLLKYNLKCDFYKVAHHGSVNNTSEEIISKILPTYAFISAGKNNVYNHPSETVLEILNKYDVITYTTITNGTIKVEITKKSYNISLFPA